MTRDQRVQADLEKATALVAKIRPYIEKFNSSDYISALANGDICLALGYSGDILQARSRAQESKNGIRVDYIIPKEGTLISFDSFAIPNDAPHPEAAFAFINYMMRPEVAAKNSNYVYYANGNKDSQPLLNKDILGDPAVYPDAAILQRLFTLRPREPGPQRLINRLWTNLKAGT